ncbi:MAG: glycosyltransferase family 8 protein [Methanobrevibacter sp.]|nr:glycosyltransferase family 8 protein [Candidatus Methanovirga aequatorialis]
MDLEIALTSDDNFIMQMGVCIISIMENNSNFFDKINIHILNNGISDENIEKLSLLENQYKKLSCIYYDVEFIKKIIPEFGKYNSAQHLGFSTYSRLFLSSLVRDIDKILYLDSDIVVNDSLFEFYNVDFDDNYMVGILDTLPYFIQKKIGMDSNSLFVNAGVLLIHLRRWRTENIEKKFIKILNEFSSQNAINDQNIINKALSGEMIILDRLKYNATPNIFFIGYDKFKKLEYLLDNSYVVGQENLKTLSDDEIKKEKKKLFKEARENPTIIHFLGGGFWTRPWEDNCNHPFSYKFIEYKNISPWKDVPLLKIGGFPGLSRNVIRYVVVKFPAYFVLLVYRIILILRY